MGKGKKKWKGTYEEWSSGLSADERNALIRYTDAPLENGTSFSGRDDPNYHKGNYLEVNSPLRFGVDEVPVPGIDGEPGTTAKLDEGAVRDLEKQRTDMDSAIDKFELKKPIVVTRRSNADLVGGLTDPDAIMERFGGRVVRDPGYLSTSTNPHPPLIDGNILYKIAVPAGKGRGAYLDPMSKFQGEKEFLLKRNTEMVVMRAYKDAETDQTVVELQA